MSNNTILLSELQSILKNQIAVDYIAICTTEWHLTGIQAFLGKINQKKCINLNGIILIKKHPSKGYMLTPDVVEERIKGANCFLYKEAPGEKKISLRRANSKKGKKIYIISANSPSIPIAAVCLKAGLKNIELIVVDEGISCYFSRFYWLKEKYQEEHNLVNTLILLLKYMSIDILKFVCGLTQHNFLLMKRKKNKLVPNLETVSFYKDIILDKEKKKIDFNPASKYSIFLSQPLVEDGLIDKNTLFEFYKYLNLICKKNGLQLYFKLHPREKNFNIYRDCGLNIINNGIDAETFIYSLNRKPEHIMGCFTTSLVSIKLFFSMDTISVNKMISEKNIPKNLEDILNNFNNNFKDLICIPSEKELLSSLRVNI